MGRAVAGPVADVGEVRHRQVVVPVVLVHRVVARAVCALEVGLPRLVRRADQVADIAGADRVPGVHLQWVVERNAERAAAGQSEVVAVARVFLSEELTQQAGPRQQAVQVRGLAGVPDDRAVVLVLEVEDEHVPVAGHVRGRRDQRQRALDRGGDAEPQRIGDRPVIAHARRVRAVEIGQRRCQDQRDLCADRPPRESPGHGPASQPAGPGPPAHRADRAAGEHRARGGHERYRDPCAAGGRAAEPGREPVPSPGGQQRTGYFA